MLDESSVSFLCELSSNAKLGAIRPRMYGAQSFYGIVFLCVSFASLAWLSYELRFASLSKVWPSTTGMIESMNSGGPSHPSYTYVVQDKRYTNNRLDYGVHLFSETAGFMNQHGIGPVRVWYDPADPSRSCLIAGFDPLGETLLFAVPLAFFVAGAAVFLLPQSRFPICT